MGMQSDVWSATWFNNTAALRAPAAVASATALTLLTDNLPFNGTGAKVTVTSDDDDNATNFVVVGTDMTGAVQTETITGVNTNTITGTKYFTTVTSVTPMRLQPTILA
jgi:hypothetical protein